MKLRNTMLWFVACTILVVVNVLIFQRETVRKEGFVMFVKLAPRDPRSLIQGDYMDLGYVLPAFLRKPGISTQGQVVARLDDRRVATIIRLHTPDAPLAENEHLLQYRMRDGQIQFAAHAFFFQEGHAQYYEDARYGELRVSESGESVLVGLRDEHLNPLGPPEE